MDAPKPNVDPSELAKFNTADLKWWDKGGPLKGLHDINPLRLQYITARVSLTGKNVLDIGCGGGILTEALARSKAHVTGIDANAAPLAAAGKHLSKSHLDISYRQITAEKLAQEKQNAYDVVTCMELLEHVPEPASVVAACAELARPGGDIFFATLNKTLRTYLFAILAAEYVLGIMRKGTHQFSKLIKPTQLELWGKQAGLVPSNFSGLQYNPLLKINRLGGSLAINYLAHFKKPE